MTIILAPFHGGVRGTHVGAGPLHLMELGLAEHLAPLAKDVEVCDLGEIAVFEGEIGRTFEVKRRVSSAVRKAVHEGRFPLVLAGNCNVEVGTFSGLGSPNVDLVWFDGHTDFYTPDDIASGYFDSMGAATLTGRCWHRLASTVPGFHPLSTSRLIYCGLRNLESGLSKRLAAEGIRMACGGAEKSASIAMELDRMLGAQGNPVLVHLDLDCLDTSEGYANEYAEPGGLSARELLDCFDRIIARSTPLSLTVASFDPSQEGAERIGEVSIQAIRKLVKSLR